MATATKDRAKSKDAAAKAKAKDEERAKKAAKAKAEEKAAKAKEKEKAAKAKEKEKAAKAKEKAAKAKEKEKAAKAKEKERAAKAKEKERAAKAKERGAKQDGGAGTGPRSRSGSTRPARSAPRSGSPTPTVHEKGWIAEELGRADAVERSTKRPTLAASFTTRDHDVIRRWAESRGGVPADVRGTGDGGKGGAGVLRIEFRDEADRLEEVDWDAFFATFEASDVDFLYQEFTKDGGESRFHKIVRTDS